MIRIIAAFLFYLIVGAVQAQTPSSGAPMVPNGAPVAGSAGSGSVGLLAKSGTASSITGTLTETPLATITIPANALGANGQLRINAYWTTTNSVNNKTLRVRLGAGGIGGSADFTGVMTTVGNVWSATLITNANATNSQFALSEAARGSDGLVTTGFNATSAIDMTASQSLVITGQLANTGETITLNSYSVEYAN